MGAARPLHQDSRFPFASELATVQREVGERRIPQKEMLTYSSNRSITVEEFRDVLLRSTLGERRPIGDSSLLLGMIENSNLIVTCWDEEKLIGISRSVTDFH